MYDILKHNFLNPDPEFSVVPFWLLNDDLDEAELIRQIDEMYAKGINGIVLHPRIGLPQSIQYMSDVYLDYIEICIRAAEKNGMFIVLYDEAGYPSGSAHGMVAASNPEFAARALYKDEESGEYVLGYTGGTIRGIHESEDDGQPNAPLAADLLNFDAMRKFIELTHEKYYERFAEYFGKTIIGIFTDEPSLTGRGANMKGKITWTEGLNADPDGNKSTYEKAIRERLGASYYGQLADWCNAHSVALMGHPAEGGDTDMQLYFGIPGQDMVWRYISPENYLDNSQSVVGKCSADMARHMETRRNSNEVLGVCGQPGNPWNFTVSEMMWYLNNLFARGVNMIIPHAFYYSLRTPIQYNERPPDVGMNSVWWRYYDRFAAYIKRMCWLNTNSVNKPYAAVLCQGETMPYASVKELYENGIDFNYLNVPLMLNKGKIENGRILIGHYAYEIVLIDDSVVLDESAQTFINEFENTGGKVCRSGRFLDFVKDNAVITETFAPMNPHLRITHLNKCSVNYILLVNEGYETIEGNLTTELIGKYESLNPFTGEIIELTVNEDGTIPLKIQPRVPTIIAVDARFKPKVAKSVEYYVAEELDISEPITINKSNFEKYILSFDEVCDQCRVFINGNPAGEMLFIPWELDVTEHIVNGMNVFTFEIDESPANKYGNPVKSGVFGGKLLCLKQK